MSIFLIILAGLAIWAVAATVLFMVRDGYHRLPIEPELALRTKEPQPNYR